ncbi:MAG: glycosyltransferase family 4 protein [Flavobacterium sp.]|uniref:glycosyltransferase family 4 protein n=1 Tax=Flavobacterium sp. TaxID=239 RepID=UPI003BA7C098
MKKVVIISSEFPPLPGGIGNHAFFLSKYLNKNEYQVSVISDYRSPDDDSAFDQKQTFSVIRIKRNWLTYFNRIFNSYLVSKQSQIIISSGKFSLWIGALLSIFLNKKKFIGILHGSELRAGGFVSQSLTKWSLSKFNSLIAVSEFTKQKALEINNQLSVKVINNGIEIDETNFSKNYTDKNINLVTVGNLTFRKGQQNIIKALPLLITKYPKIQYHCIGIPAEKDYFLQLAKELNVLPHITFHGALSEDKKNAILAKSTIFCMLSSVLKNGDVEGFGIAILEANLLGIPAIGSNNSGIVDAIHQKYSGLLIDPNDANQFLLAIDDILCNYDEYSKNAKNWAKKFDWNQIILNYIDSIES